MCASKRHFETHRLKKKKDFSERETQLNRQFCFSKTNNKIKTYKKKLAKTHTKCTETEINYALNYRVPFCESGVSIQQYLFDFSLSFS